MNFEKTSHVVKDASNYQESAVIFNVHDTIKSSGEIILLDVSYSNDIFLSRVFVYISDEMIVGDTLDTKHVSDIGHMYCVYEKEDFTINYKVVNG